MRFPRFLAFQFVLAVTAFAQTPGLTLPPSGNNQKAAVSQFVGPVKVSIEYSSPSVHDFAGQDRRGKIWGQLVPYGLTDLGFGHRKPSPWRAGANENTVFEVSHPVTIEGKPLPAGRYGLHFIVDPNEWTLILSKNSTSWGSFTYEESEDALRVKVRPRKHEYREYLTYDFPVRKGDEATAELRWEDLAVAWNIKVPESNGIYISELRKQLRDSPGFTWQSFVAAAQFCVQAKTNLEQALQWAEAAAGPAFPGEANFTTLSTKAQVLTALNRGDEARAIMATAVKHPTAQPNQIHQYGRQLLAENKPKEAMEIFQLNAQRHGEVWPVHVGLMRGYQALGDKAKALEHARKALAQAPNKLNRDNLENMVKQLSAN